MNPYSNHNIQLDQQIFNYKLSRARRIIENTFGIATTRFGIFRRPISATPKKVILVTKAVVALHNYLMKRCTNAEKNKNYSYCSPSYTDQETRSGMKLGVWRKEQENTGGLQQIQQTGSNNYSRDASTVRNNVKNYFCSPEGSIEWQMERVKRIY